MGAEAWHRAHFRCPDSIGVPVIHTPHQFFQSLQLRWSQASSKQTTLTSSQLGLGDITVGFLHCCGPRFHPCDEGDKHVSSHESRVWINVPVVRFLDGWAAITPPSIHISKAPEEMQLTLRSSREWQRCRKRFGALHPRTKRPRSDGGWMPGCRSPQHTLTPMGAGSGRWCRAGDPTAGASTALTTRYQHPAPLPALEGQAPGIPPGTWQRQRYPLQLLP